MPLPVRDTAEAPVLLTAQPLLRSRADLSRLLCTEEFDLRFVATWDLLPEGVERTTADIVLVDMDAVDDWTEGARKVSGRRLVALLARWLAHRATALVVMTKLDYVEVEDLARAGVHALVSPDLQSAELIGHIRAALERVRERHCSREP